MVLSSVNVSVLLYEPERSTSVAPIACRRPSVTASEVVGPA